MKRTSNTSTKIKNNNFTFFTQISRALKISLFLCALFLSGSVKAQDSADFNRNGRWLVETGYSFVSGIVGGGTGVSYFSNDGSSLTSIGAEIGKFTSQNLAFKLRLALLSSEGLDLTNVGAGAKYYINGSIPIDVGAGILSGGGDSEFIGNFSLGYALNLAPNIALEPAVGGFISNGEFLFNFKIGFAMFL